MRIAFLSWESLHSIMMGGVAYHVTELACALERKGHEVHVFTRLGRPNHPLYECIDGVHYHRCPYSSHSDPVEENKNMCRSIVSAVYAAEDFAGAFDIVHAHDWLTAHALAWIKWGRGRKTVFTVHSTEFGRSGNVFHKGISKTIRDIEWFGAFEADRVIAVSNALKNEVKWIYSIPDWKVSAVHNGISYWHFNGWINPAAVKARYGIAPLDPVVLFVGRMTSQKGPDLLVESIPNILKFYPRAKFVFAAGDGNLHGSVEARAWQLGVYHATRFFGYLDRWQLIDLYKACDCVCVPSRNEPFGIVILEAWAAGKPVVATDNGGPSELLWHNVTGYKVNATVDSISWGLGTLFSNFEHARWMGQNGRFAAEKCFSWDTISEKTLDVYYQLVPRPQIFEQAPAGRQEEKTAETGPKETDIEEIMEMGKTAVEETSIELVEYKETAETVAA
ncbi:MAG TPA: glycosyltransferase family 4 protein [Chitinivibrionales bacterium]|nr:glycosyltransferase family 4 protein [Chitinivibrionales bacterium]